MALLVGFELSTAAQTAAARPERGVGPAGSYAVSDTGNVSLMNGNMSLSFPLAGLPPIAGGKLSWALRAEYNSKLWDTVRAEHLSDPVNPNSKYVVSGLQLSGVSGWRVGATYQISFEDDDWDYDWIAPTPNDPEYNLLTQNRWTKVVLTTPDGAEHELRPVDYGSYPDGFNRHSHLRGYYKENPNSVGAAMRYYSFDGSYLWAKIDPSPYLFAGAAPSWTLHLPDGTKVEQLNGVQRITDTNGNKIKIWTDVSGAGVSTKHYQDEQTGREVRYVYDPAGNGGQGQGQAQYQTVGGGWALVDINFGMTHVYGKRYEFGDPECADAADYVDAWLTVVRSVVLPQTEPGQPRRQFTFTYNSDAVETTGFQWRPDCGAYQTVTQASRGWGSLSQMVTPSGATVGYAYGLDGEHYLTSTPDDAPREALNSKVVTHDGVTDTWLYSVGPLGGGVAGPDGLNVNETRYPSDPAFKHSFAGYGGKEGLVYRTNQSDKVVVERRWRLLTFASGDNISAGASVLAAFNPVVEAEYTTLKENGQAVRMSAKSYAHDYNGNVTEVKEYDWFDPALVTRDAEGVPTGVPAGAVLLRTTNTSYHNSPGTNASSPFVYAKRQLGAATHSNYGAVISATVGPGETRFSYDGQAYGAAPTAGNVTQVSRRDDKGDTNPGNDTWVNTATAYGAYGNVSSTTDPNGHVTQFFYDDLTHALPTRAVVDPLNGTGSQTTTTAYDFSTGLVTSVTDANGQTSTVDYTNHLLGSVDPLGRPGVAAGPVVVVNGVSQRRKVFTFYEDAARRVRVESDLNVEGDRLLKSRTTSDQLGRAVLSEQTENGSTYTISTQTFYAQAGRVTLESFPTRGDGSSPDGWTRVTNDALGRVIEAATFAGAAQPSATTPANQLASWTGSVTTSYSANETVITDQAGKVRKSVTDGLGRIAQVVEAPGIPGYGYVTHYAYDAPGNLRRVEQGGQLRYFMYDSLSRLIRAKNTEQSAASAASNVTDPVTGNGQWSAAYGYDAAGNVISRVDARGVTATYTYDGLNRNTSVTYSDGTPGVIRIYDGAVNGKGRYHADWTRNGAGMYYTHRAVDHYDAMGRPLDQRQYIYVNNAAGSAFNISRTYDLTGNVRAQTYPSGRSVGYGYDSAGRLNSFAGNLGDGAQRTYSMGVSYDAAGRVRQEQFGTQTPVYNKRLYNNRNQLAEIRLSTYSLYTQGQETNWNRGAIINHYSNAAGAWGATGGGPDNNSNLLRQEIYVPNDDQISGYVNFVEHYGYDALNRLTSVEEKPFNAWTSLTQAYAYDRWGNRTINNAGTWNAPAPQYTASAVTNRLAPPAGYSLNYDAAGNLTNDSYTGYGSPAGQQTRFYDAENRMTSAPTSAAQTAIYSYDADGRRVKRNDGATGEVWQVYGLSGELLAEYAAGASPSSPQKEYGYRSGELLVTAEPSAAETVWVEDSLPAGASGFGDGEGWNWVGANPASHSGSLSHQSNVVGGMHQHFFVGATAKLSVGAGEKLVAYVYLDPANTPSEVMLQWNSDQEGWNHRAYWGADLLGWGTGGTGSRRHMGGLPASGQWARLEVPASLVGLEGKTLNGMAYSLYGGRATWDKAGKAGAGAGAGVRWLVADQLGTPRMVLDQTGSLAGVSRHDYLPFGEELFAGVGGRTPAQGYGAGDNVRQKFTGKELDGETGLTYFLARYCSTAQGRFTAFDPGPYTLADPQSWNRYSYVQNNPLKFIDPDGETLILRGPEAEYIVGQLEKATGYKLKRDEKTGVVTIDETTKRNTEKTSKRLADKLKEIADPRNKVEVNITVGSNLHRTLGDAFRDQAIDAADYRVYERDAPELGAALLGHVLSEYYEIAKEGLNPKTVSPAIFEVVYHKHALAFEGQVLSDLTGKEQGARISIPGKEEKGRRGATFQTQQYAYDHVTYDILTKTVTASSGRRRIRDVQVTGVKRR